MWSVKFCGGVKLEVFLVLRFGIGYILSHCQTKICCFFFVWGSLIKARIAPTYLVFRFLSSISRWTSETTALFLIPLDLSNCLMSCWQFLLQTCVRRYLPIQVSMFSGIPPGSNSAKCTSASLNWFLLAKNGGCWEQKIGQQLYKMCIYTVYIIYFLPKYKIVIKCCRKYAYNTYGWFDDQRNMSIYVHYWKLYKFCIQTHKTHLLGCVVCDFFLLALSKLRRSDRAMGQLLRILVMFLFPTHRRVFPKMLLGASAPEQKTTSEFCFEI